MHEDDETKLARTDQHDGKDVRQGVGENGHKRHRAEDNGPCMGDEGNALPFDPLAQLGELVGRHELACGDPVRCGDAACGHEKILSWL